MIMFMMFIMFVIGSHVYRSDEKDIFLLQITRKYGKFEAQAQ